MDRLWQVRQNARISLTNGGDSDNLDRLVQTLTSQTKFQDLSDNVGDSANLDRLWQVRQNARISLTM